MEGLKFGVRVSGKKLCFSYRFLAVAKRPCDCCVDQFWPNVTGRRYFADIISLSSTTVT